MIRVRPSPIDNVPDLVADWGLELWPDEVVGDQGLCFAQFDGVPGYVLVTSSRLRFLVPRKGKPPEVPVNRELRLLRGATIERRRMRRVAVLRFDDAEYVVRVETGDPEQLVSQLTV
jgi:hypothetical protein